MLGSKATLKTVCLPDSFETWFALSGGETSFVLSETVVILGQARLCARESCIFQGGSYLCKLSSAGFLFSSLLVVIFLLFPL